MTVNVNLSANLVVGGAVVPLSTQDLDMSKLSLDDLNAAIKAGISFGLPANSSISTNLGGLVDWLKTKADKTFTMPDAIDKILGDAAKDLNSVSITIMSFHVNTAGHFDIAIIIHFEGGLDKVLHLPPAVSEIIDINDIGFSFSYDKTTTVNPAA